jgi:hypothetical protein
LESEAEKLDVNVVEKADLGRLQEVARNAIPISAEGDFAPPPSAVRAILERVAEAQANGTWL